MRDYFEITDWATRAKDETHSAGREEERNVGIRAVVTAFLERHYGWKQKASGSEGSD